MSSSSQIRNDIQGIGLDFLDAVREGLTRDMAKAMDMFRVPRGQLAYVLQGGMNRNFAGLTAMGLPFRFTHKGRALNGAVRHVLNAPGSERPTDLQGWEEKALEVATRTWWLKRDTANRDPGLCALTFGYSSRTETDELANLAAREITELGYRTFREMPILDTVCMQIAYVMCDAPASHDRIAVLRGSCPIANAA